LQRVLSRNTMVRVTFILLIAAVLVSTVTGCNAKVEQKAQDKTIMFGDFNWDSALINNRIAQFIIENGYGYKTDSMPGETIPLMQGLSRGDIDVAMEIWIQNAQEAYDKGIADGSFIDLGTNFNDNVQGMFVPAYVVKGDPERGIEPMAPDLKSYKDLPNYKHLFQDPEDPNKGRFYGAVPGWEADYIITEKFETYGLSEHYNIFRPGSGASLASSLVSAYEKGQPWFGYYWGPTWIFGKLDLIQIEEPPYSEELWNNGYGCQFPAVDVNIVVHKDLPEQAPEIVEFLKKYEVKSDIISEALAYMNDEGVEADQAAIWFLKEKQDIWTTWVSDEIAEKVKQKL